MRGRTVAAVTTTGLLCLSISTVPAGAQASPSEPGEPTKEAVATGYGGAVSSVDPDATAIGLDVLRRGGNAIDAAVATAAALGVTEPYSAGVGGGGFFVYYDASSGTVRTLDGRETAPASLESDGFLDPDGEPYPFEELVGSGISVGVPGTPDTWAEALADAGSMSLADVLAGPTALARRGFVVDETFREQTLENAERFRDFSSTADLFLPDGDAPAVGSVFRNPDLADTYRLMAEQGTDAFYAGELGRAVVATVNAPPVADGVTRDVLTGGMTEADLLAYDALERVPTHVRHGDYDVFGMAPPSSGGSTVGEALNIFETAGGTAEGLSAAEREHLRLEAAALAFADRNRWVGDGDVQDVPTRRLTSEEFAATRACLVSPDAVLPRPVAPGALDASGCGETAEASAAGREGPSTTHLTTSDAEGNVVAYTLTIEQTGGSGIVVPERGFLLNNELTDFNAVPVVEGVPDPNLPGPGKRPRSSMAPTIVLQDGSPVLAVGSPGGATIIGTVYGILVNRLDGGQSLLDAVAAPRVSEQNSAAGAAAEQEYLDSDLGRELLARGHVFRPTGEIGAAAAIEFLPDGRARAVAEPTRRGGGSAGVVRPAGD